MTYDFLITLLICTQNLCSIGPTVPDIQSCTKQREIWPLTFICIVKMASYQLDVIIRYECLVTLHMHNKIWAQSDPKFLRYKTKRDLTFDLHLHSQDRLISTWCYYEIWLPGHTPYAHKLWAQSDIKLLRYKTKGDWPLTFICIAKMASYCNESRNKNAGSEFSVQIWSLKALLYTAVTKADRSAWCAYYSFTMMAQVHLNSRRNTPTCRYLDISSVKWSPTGLLYSVHLKHTLIGNAFMNAVTNFVMYTYVSSMCPIANSKFQWQTPGFQYILRENRALNSMHVCINISPQKLCSGPVSSLPCCLNPKRETYTTFTKISHLRCVYA